MKGYKKILTIFILMIFLIPFSVSAKSFSIDENMNVDIDDSLWYVFTRTNLDNNQELATLNISPSEMKAFLENNQAYLNGLLIYKSSGETLQVFVRRIESGKEDLTRISDQAFIDLVKASLTYKNISLIEMYKNNGYRFVYSEYEENSKYVVDYYVVNNFYNYTITFQKEKPFNADNKARAKEIIDTISFISNAPEKEESGGFFDSTIGKVLIGLFFIGIVGGVLFIILRSNIKNKKMKNMMVKNPYNNNFYNNQYNQYNNMNNYNGNYYNNGNNGYNNYYNNNNNGNNNNNNNNNYYNNNNNGNY